MQKYKFGWKALCRNALLILGWMISSSVFSYNNQYSLIATCFGEHPGGYNLMIKFYLTQNKELSDIITIGQAGDADQHPYPASVIAENDMITFNVEEIEGSLQLQGEFSDDVQVDVKIKSNDKGIGSINFVCGGL